jgi:hypothetical protein
MPWSSFLVPSFIWSDHVVIGEWDPLSWDFSHLPNDEKM